jgi:hypothetical protein
MATSGSIPEYQRFTPAWPALLAAGAAVVLLALLAPAFKWLMVYLFKDV